MEGDEKPNLNENPEIDDILHSSSPKAKPIISTGALLLTGISGFVNGQAQAAAATHAKTAQQIPELRDLSHGIAASHPDHRNLTEDINNALGNILSKTVKDGTVELTWCQCWPPPPPGPWTQSAGPVG